MSIRSKRVRKGKIINDINVVPYIDVMLVLLVIFMVTAPLITTGILNLPEVSKTAPKTENIVTIEIRKNESIKIKSQADRQGKIVSRSTLLENVKRMQSVGDSAVVISAEKNVPYNMVLETIETLHVGGVNRVGLLVKKKQ